MTPQLYLIIAAACTVILFVVTLKMILEPVKSWNAAEANKIALSLVASAVISTCWPALIAVVALWGITYLIGNLVFRIKKKEN